jgi:gluconate 5-dehydrogenase
MKTLRELFDLTGRSALVTGGAGHLGSAIARALAEAGANVAVASRNVDNCKAVAAELGPNSLALPLDIGNEDTIRGTIDAVASHFGRLDVLVNSAYSGPRPDLESATGKDFDEALHLTITAYFVASQQAVRHMRRNGGGSIIQIASIFGMVSSYPDVVNSPPTYHAGKGGLVHLARYLAVYWAPDQIRVNCISPGPFPTAAGLKEKADYYRGMSEQVPMKRLGRDWEIKGAAVFLASEASSFMTGHNLVLDGGWTAW